MTNASLLSHPRGETPSISPHHHERTSNQPTTCARALRRNSPNNASQQKEKIPVRRNSPEAKSSYTALFPHRPTRNPKSATRNFLPRSTTHAIHEYNSLLSTTSCGI